MVFFAFGGGAPLVVVGLTCKGRDAAIHVATLNAKTNALPSSRACNDGKDGAAAF